MCLARHCANDLLMTARNFDEQVLNEFIRVAQNRLKNNKKHFTLFLYVLRCSNQYCLLIYYTYINNITI